MQEKLATIARLSQHFGSNPDYVFLGGGNTSVKNETELYIKPSGTALATIKPEQFLKMDRAALAQVFAIPTTADAALREAMVKTAQEQAVRPFGAGRPSVEAPLHNIIEYTYIVHLHPALVNGMTCAINGKAACAELFPEAIWVDYCDPGYTLSKAVKDELDAAKAKNGKQPQVIFLQNHGVFVGADSEQEIITIYEGIFAKLQKVYGADLLKPIPKFAPADIAAVQEAAPALRTLLAADNGARPVVRSLGDGKVFAGPLTPDHIVYARSFAYCGPANKASLDAYKKERGYAPKLLKIDGAGVFATAADLKTAAAPEIALYNALYIEQLSQAFGGPNYLSPAQYGFIENWEVESYRSKVSAGAAAGGRLENRICMVTGGAQGFGLGIAEYLAANGGIIIIADVNADGAKKAADGLCEKFGANRAFSVAADISNEESVEKVFAEIACLCGGLDLLVANAGVAKSGSVMQLEKKVWDFVTNINYTGYFLCVKHASRLMSKQIVDGAGRWLDIVQVNSKSGLEGSNKNGAYAGSKFGGIGLTQSFAKELVENHIKVNSVCPGNYYDGPLWSDPVKGLFIQYLNDGKVPGAKNVDDVKKFYMDKVPMHRGCLPSDVAKAIIYCVEQEYETGQAIPVTGGQVMLH